MQHINSSKLEDSSIFTLLSLLPLTVREQEKCSKLLLLFLSTINQLKMLNFLLISRLLRLQRKLKPLRRERRKSTRNYLLSLLPRVKNLPKLKRIRRKVERKELMKKISITLLLFPLKSKQLTIRRTCLESLHSFQYLDNLMLRLLPSVSLTATHLVPHLELRTPTPQDIFVNSG